MKRFESIKEGQKVQIDHLKKEKGEYKTTGLKILLEGTKEGIKVMYPKERKE